MIVITVSEQKTPNRIEECVVLTDYLLQNASFSNPTKRLQMPLTVHSLLVTKYSLEDYLKNQRSVISITNGENGKVPFPTNAIIINNEKEFKSFVQKMKKENEEKSEKYPRITEEIEKV